MEELSCHLQLPRIWPWGSVLHVSLKGSAELPLQSSFTPRHPEAPFGGWVPCEGSHSEGPGA